MTNTIYIYSLVRSYGTHDMYHGSMYEREDDSSIVPFKCLSMAVFTEYIRNYIHSQETVVSLLNVFETEK